jgi:hypothetical protein
MARYSQSGQIVIELAIVSLLLVGVFLLAISISETSQKSLQKHRFATPWRRK